jgi:hypothetical protein
VKRVLIVGHHAEPVANRVEAQLLAKGTAVVRVIFEEIAGGAPIRFDGSTWTWKGDPLEALSGVLVRRIPVLGAMLSSDPEEALTAGEWWRRELFG